MSIKATTAQTNIMSDSVMVDGHGGGGGGGASAVPMGNGDGGVANNSDADKVVYRKPRNRGGGGGGGAGGAKERFTNPNGVFSRPKSEYISPCEFNNWPFLNIICLLIFFICKHVGV